MRFYKEKHLRRLRTCQILDDFDFDNDAAPYIAEQVRHIRTAEDAIHAVELEGHPALAEHQGPHGWHGRVNHALAERVVSEGRVVQCGGILVKQ